MFSSYLLNKTELFIKFLHCWNCNTFCVKTNKHVYLWRSFLGSYHVINLWKRDLEPLMKTSEILFLLLKKII